MDRESMRGSLGMTVDGGSITRWIGGLRAGDDLAAEHVWQRYYERLVAQARRKFNGSPRRVADEDDVVTSAFESFFRGARNGRFPRLDDRDDLWQVLLMLTARKIADQVAAQRCQKRGGGTVRGHSIFPDETRDDLPETACSSEPDPEFAAEVAEQCRFLLGQLDEGLRQVTLMKMEGYTNREIAEKLNCKERTVQRKLRMIREIWSLEKAG